MIENVPSVLLNSGRSGSSSIVSLPLAYILEKEQ